MLIQPSFRFYTATFRKDVPLTPKSENDRLKVLKMPSQETEFKHLDNQYKDEVNALKEKLENLQEQIKVKKRIEEQEKPRKWWGLWRK